MAPKKKRASKKKGAKKRAAPKKAAKRRGAPAKKRAAVEEQKEAPAAAAEEEEDEFAFLRPSETLRKRLLREELKLRKVQPDAWTRIKYRKNVKLPKDLFKKSRRKKTPKRMYVLAPEKGVKKRRKRKVFR